jgi:type II secretory ATPase GspE/PulE/Tfp pilus assembly ATPase PilB-like protein
MAPHNPVTLIPGFFELDDVDLHIPSVRSLPRPFSRRLGALVAGDLGRPGPVRVAMAHPEDELAAREIARQLNRPIEVIRLNRYEIDRGLTLAWEGLAGLGEEHTGRLIPLEPRQPRADASATELVDWTLAEAVRLGASDIHLESYGHDVDLRLRLDGCMHQVFTAINPDNLSEVVARIMVLAELDIADKGKPQDGRFRVSFIGDGPPRTVDFRVNVAPATGGQDVVLRVLDAGKGLLPLKTLGLTPHTQERWHRLVHNPSGLLLVCGPTGSGKTTSLYASLTSLVAEGKKIITAEDPIEYVVDHVNQKQAGPFMPFSELLRAAMRQNPDVLLFGELRDRETAEVAVAAAVTGHLVMSSLHTSDAVGAVARLRGLGIKDTELSESLIGILSQRLLRRLCTQCRVQGEEGDGLTGGSSAHSVPGLTEGPVWHARACAACRGTGYKGRIGAYELLSIGEELREALAKGAPGNVLRDIARKEGQQSLAAEARRLVREGLTSPAEVLRVIPLRQLESER